MDLCIFYLIFPIQIVIYHDMSCSDGTTNHEQCHSKYISTSLKIEKPEKILQTSEMKDQCF